MKNHSFNKNILRAYDIRGVVGESLHYKDAEILGNIFSSILKNNNKIIVCRDGRLSSPKMAEHLINGLKDSGSSVIDIGVGPSPMLYFAANLLKSDGAIMVTGSHNPSNHNGFKIMKGTVPFYGDDIADIGKRANEGNWTLSPGGSVEEKDLEKKYIESLLKCSKINVINKNIKVVWDSGNGSAGKVMQKLVNYLPGNHLLLNEKIDGNFPSHHPDPTDPDNLNQLIKLVKKSNSDLGIAFDGDGDRLGVVSSTGDIVWGDQLIAFLAKEVLKNNPNCSVIADVKASESIFKEIKRLGGNPVMWKTGHSFIKSKMKEIAAPLAGEMSGHIFFSDRYYGFDDALYAALRVLELVKNNQTLNNFLESLPKSYASSEIKISCSDDKKFLVIDELGKILEKTDSTIIKVDGLRIKKENGWWLLRASNTQEALVARIEANSKNNLKLIRDELKKYLQKYDLSLENL